MKKIYILLLIILCLPVNASAVIDQNLFYGQKNNLQVKELQQFLISKNFLTGQATGNFFSLTLSAVKKYQTSKKISPTGTVGPLTRQAINSDLLSSSNSTSSSSSQQSSASSASVAVVPFSGTADLTQNTNYASQYSIAPKSNFKFADFNLQNNTTETINLKKVQVDLFLDADSYSANIYVKKLYVVYDNNKTIYLDSVAYNNYFAIDYNLSAGKTINLTVYGDVNSLIPQDSVLKTAMIVSGISANSKQEVATNLNVAISGQNTTFTSSTLTVSLDSSSPAENIYVINQKVLAGAFNFTSKSDSYTLLQAKFIVLGSNYSQAINGAILSEKSLQDLSTAKPTIATYNGKNYIFDFTLNTPISANTAKVMKFYYDFGAKSQSNYGSGKSLSPILVYVKAKNSNGDIVDGAATNYDEISFNGGITLPVEGVKTNDLYVRQSVPVLKSIISESKVTTENSSSPEIYKFSVTADKNGDISLKQITFNVVLEAGTSGFPYINNFKLLKDGKDYSGFVTIGTNINNNYIGLSSSYGISAGTNSVVVTFNKEETISAGKTQVYSLKAKVNAFALNHSVTTSILADSSNGGDYKYLRMVFNNIYGLAKNDSDIYVNNYNLLWSDKSALMPLHNDTNGFSTADWYNGFGVLSLPLTSQIVSGN